MPRAKLPRKSTNIDMTAMCDVAFLLLSFFILATKTKPPEVLAVEPPTSVSSKAAPENSILITMTRDSRVFLMLGDGVRKEEIIQKLNANMNLQFTPQELSKMIKAEFYGLPLSNYKTYLSAGKEIPAAKMEGIPVMDSSNNELGHWLKAVSDAYAGTDQRKLQEMLLVKGDGAAFYPVFKNVKQAFKKNELYKFRIVTSGEPVPAGSELYMNSKD
jgi:biopolymer transport protein ExbD